MPNKTVNYSSETDNNNPVKLNKSYGRYKYAVLEKSALVFASTTIIFQHLYVIPVNIQRTMCDDDNRRFVIKKNKKSVGIYKIYLNRFLATVCKMCAFRTRAQFTV